MPLRLFVLLSALLLILSPVRTAAADVAYPTSTVRIIVGFQPGGSVDQMARYYAKRFATDLGGTFIVENRPGASGNIGADLVAKAKPDGSTLLVTSVVHSINPSLFKSLPFDPVKDFSAVSPLALAANGVMVNPSLPVTNLRELIAYLKAHPGQVSYAEPGIGTLQNLGFQMFLAMAGVKMIDVPYDGTGPALTAVVGGQVPVLSSGYGSAAPMVKAGKLRCLGVSTAQPSAIAPGVPTMAQASGLKGYSAVAWIGLFAPAGTPASIVEKLNAEVKKIQQDPDVKPYMTAQGLDMQWLSPASFANLVKSDETKYAKVVHDLGIQPE